MRRSTRLVALLVVPFLAALAWLQAAGAQQAPIKVRGPDQERLHQLDAFNLAIALKRAIYDAGYSGPSGFYSDAKERLGMTPSAWRDGGRGETIRWTHFDSPLGQMLIAATSKGICRLTFDDSEQSLRRLFPNATIVEDAGGLNLRTCYTYDQLGRKISETAPRAGLATCS